MRVSVQPSLPGACSPGLHIWGCGPLPEPGLMVPGAWRVLCKPIAVTALGDRQELVAISWRRKTEAQRGSGTDRGSHGKCPLGRNPVPGLRRTIRKRRLSFRVPFLCHLDSSLNIQDKSEAWPHSDQNKNCSCLLKVLSATLKKHPSAQTLSAAPPPDAGTGPASPGAVRPTVPTKEPAHRFGPKSRVGPRVPLWEESDKCRVACPGGTSRPQRAAVGLRGRSPRGSHTRISSRAASPPVRLLDSSRRPLVKLDAELSQPAPGPDLPQPGRPPNAARAPRASRTRPGPAGRRPSLHQPARAGRPPPQAKFHPRTRGQGLGRENGENKNLAPLHASFPMRRRRCRRRQTVSNPCGPPASPPPCRPGAGISALAFPAPFPTPSAAAGGAPLPWRPWDL